MRPAPTSVKRNRGFALKLLGGFAACCVVALSLAAHHLDEPGLYYDEVIQAEPAARFVNGEDRPFRVPGSRDARWLGGWFPLMTQPYMGALKGQLLIPTFATFGANEASLRLTTLAWALAGLGLSMLWARRTFAFGTDVALIAGALVAVDASFLFVARHDWGSFSLGLLCRGGALYALQAGWVARSWPLSFLGGLFLGLGVYNKLDFAVWIAVAAVACVVAWPGIWRELVRRRSSTAAAALGLCVGALPMLIAIRGALAATQAVAGASADESGDWSEKLVAGIATLDGSYFQRLMLSGGRFEDLGAVAGATSGPGLLIFALASIWLAGRMVATVRHRRVDRAQLFAWTTAVLGLLAILLTPRAVRVHHFLNIYPFPQVVVALAGVDLWRSGAGSVRSVARVAAGLAFSFAMLGALRVDLHTLDAIRETGGRGRWSGAVGEFARSFAAESSAGRIVCLDWGLRGPVAFGARGVESVEPIWRLRVPGASWRFVGSEHDVYLAYASPFSVFSFGDEFVDAVKDLPEGRAQLTWHADRAGEPVLASIRFPEPHVVLYRNGRFQLGRR